MLIEPLESSSIAKAFISTLVEASFPTVIVLAEAPVPTLIAPGTASSPILIVPEIEFKARAPFASIFTPPAVALISIAFDPVPAELSTSS